MLQNKSRSWKMLLVAAAAVLSLSVMAGCGKKSGAEGSAAAATNETTGTAGTSKVVATYDGGQITESDFDLEQRIMLILSPEVKQYLNQDSFRDYLIKQEIAYKYLAAHASASDKEAGAKKADTQLAQMKTSLGAEQFKSMLDAGKVTEQQFKDYMVRIFTVVNSETASVTDAEVKQQFDKTKSDFTTASVRHILIQFKDPEGKERTKEATLKLAKDIKAKLDAGEDFATLAKKYSEDPGSKDNGGLYKDASVSQWVEEFKQAALTLPLNKISDPIETTYGYHIIRVESRSSKTFDQLTADQIATLKNQTGGQKLDAFIKGDLESKIIKNINLPKVPVSSAPASSTNPSASLTPSK